MLGLLLDILRFSIRERSHMTSATLNVYLIQLKTELCRQFRGVY